MARVELGVAAAFVASALYDLGIAVQAIEARRAPREHALRPSLIASLGRRRVWLGGTALVALGWPLEILALTQAPLTLVAPALAVGLLLLLALGRRMLGERVGPREVAGMVAIVGGVAGIGIAAPDHTSGHASTASIALGLAALGTVALLPYLRRSRNAAGIAVVTGAGAAYAWNEFASKLISDHLVNGELLAAAGLTALTAASAVLGLVSEMTALQHRPATQVAPLVYVVQVTVPVLLAPLLGGEDWGETPLGGAVLVLLLVVVAGGAALLAGSRLVAAATESAVQPSVAGAAAPASSRHRT
jgi:drug/metabolite transporter (DMT)-like permease